jgi:mannuronan 5-epimerase
MVIYCQLFNSNVYTLKTESLLLFYETLRAICALVTLAIIILVSSATLTNTATYAQLQNTLGIKITSHEQGQEVPAGELTISGTSTDNATSDCTVYTDWNNTKPFQKAIATGPGGLNDYSNWTFTYTDKYHHITNGTNELTSKLSCLDSPTTNLTKWSSIDVIAGEINENKQQGLFSTTAENDCISYNDVKRLINVSCKLANLTDIYNQINNHEVLDKEPQQQGVWLLNANLTIDKGSTLTIDPNDTTWLKIITDGKTLAYGIHIYGSLKIDSVKVTSWNPETNYYGISNGSRESSGPSTAACGSNCTIAQKDLLTHHGAPRPYIRIESRATGTTNITNSYLGYLGYEGGWGKKTSGLYYNAGHGSIIRNSEIDNLYFGFYSVNVGHIVIENNRIHNSGHYGIDPHTGTHDMIIRNNTVYHNNGTAIICSVNCYNITYENNKVYDNNGAGITFSRNTTHSVAKNNYIHNQIKPIEVSKSHNNEVYNNMISNTNTSGISLIGDSSENKIYNNTIINSQRGLSINDTSTNNTIYNNKIIDANLKDIDIAKEIANYNVIEDTNQIINNNNNNKEKNK